MAQKINILSVVVVSRSLRMPLGPAPLQQTDEAIFFSRAPQRLFCTVWQEMAGLARARLNKVAFSFRARALSIGRDASKLRALLVLA